MTSRLKAQKKDFKRIEKEAKREFKQEEKAKRRAERDSRDPYRGSHGDRRSRSRSRDSRSRPGDYDERYDRERDYRDRAPASSRDRYRDADRGRDAGRERRRSRSKSPVGKQEVRSLGVADKTPPRNQDRYRLVRSCLLLLPLNRVQPRADSCVPPRSKPTRREERGKVEDYDFEEERAKERRRWEKYHDRERGMGTEWGRGR
jgi:RNA-binding protein 39